MLTDHRDELEAIKIRHADVDEHDTDIHLQQRLQRLAAGVRLDEVLAEFVQNDFVGEQFRRLIVDEEDVDLFLIGHGGFYLCSHRRSAESSCSVLTGLAR